MRPKGLGGATALVSTGIALAVLLAPVALAQSPEDVANDISREIMSPYCPGVTLHDCTSAPARALRERIEGWAARGWSRDRIMDELVAEYDSSILAAPPAAGSGLLAWILPAMAVVAGVGVFWTLARGWAARQARADPTRSTTISSSERERLERELRTFRSER